MGLVTTLHHGDRYIPHNFEGLLDNSHGKVSPIVYQACYVVLRHLRQLFLKYTLEPSEDDETFALVVIIDHPEFYLAISFLGNRGLI